MYDPRTGARITELADFGNFTEAMAQPPDDIEPLRALLRTKRRGEVVDWQEIRQATGWQQAEISALLRTNECYGLIEVGPDGTLFASGHGHRAKEVRPFTPESLSSGSTGGAVQTSIPPKPSQEELNAIKAACECIDRALAALPWTDDPACSAAERALRKQLAQLERAHPEIKREREAAKAAVTARVAAFTERVRAGRRPDPEGNRAARERLTRWSRIASCATPN